MSALRWKFTVERKYMSGNYWWCVINLDGNVCFKTREQLTALKECKKRNEEIK